jgi:hypothetical protein
VNAGAEEREQKPLSERFGDEKSGRRVLCLLPCAGHGHPVNSSAILPTTEQR